MTNTVIEIDEIIQRNNFFDFHILKYDGKNLVIGASEDLLYYHKLEILFEEVFFVSAFFSGWRCNTQDTVFYVPENVKELNKKYEIEQGYQIFIFKTENYNNDIIIASKSIHFNTDTVYYYLRQDLKENERIIETLKQS